MVTGNTVVALASERRPLPAVSLSEVLATSDVPGGVINVLTGRTAEIAPWLASHMDVNAIDLTGAPDPTGRRPGRRRRRQPQARHPPRRARTGPSPPACNRMLAYLETKTVWHPAGV